MMNAPRSLLLLTFFLSLGLPWPQRAKVVAAFTPPANWAHSSSSKTTTPAPPSQRAVGPHDDGSTYTTTGSRLLRLQQSQQQRQRGSRTSLQAASAFAPLAAIAASPLGSISILAGIVLIHECGHYFAAKSFGIDVEEFSVGFGPKIFGFKIKNDEFNLRALPLGGYVRFPDNYNTTLARLQAEEESVEAEEFIANQELGFGSKILNAVTLGAISDKLWMDEKKRRYSDVSSSATESSSSEPWWKQLVGGRQKTSSKPVDPYEIEYYDDPNLLQNRPWQQRAVVLSGGVFFNLLLSFVLYFGQINFGPGLPVPEFDNGIVVSASPRPEAAANGILRKGDVIVGVNGQPIMSESKPSVYETQRAINQFVSRIRATGDDEVLSIDVLRNNQPAQLTVQPQRASDASPKTIGVLLSPNYVKTGVLKTNDPIAAADLSLRYVTTLTKETANGLVSFASGLISGSGGAGNQVAGPIGLIKTGSDVVATQDWTAIVLFAAAISINLGVINAIPLPALDGGQLMFVLAEAVTGRRVDQRLQEGITGVAVLFLLLLSAGTFVGDITSIMGR